MIVGFASDHAGYELKQVLVSYLKDNEINNDLCTIVDYGCNSEERVDYPDFVKLVGLALAKKEIDIGIVVCGSGVGASIVVNKIKGIRCALCHNIYTTQFSRMHNDANVMAIGGRVIGTDLAIKMMESFLTTAFEGGRHKDRVDKIHLLEQ